MAIWSTGKINQLIENYEATGVIPRDNPFHKRDIQLKDEDINFEYTEIEIQEISKSRLNIVHFGETYCEVMTDSGIRIVKLRPYQIRNLRQLVYFKLNVWLASRQSGKCVAFDTEIEVYDKSTDETKRIPIYKFFYKHRHMNFLTKIEKFLFDVLYRIEKYELQTTGK